MAAFKRARTLAAVALVVGFGVARLPVEARFTAAQRDLGFRGAQLDLAVRDQLSQNLAVAVLGGFRSLTASILSLKAHSSWEFTDWDSVEAHYDVITKLQPRVEHYWWEAARYMAYDAASNYLYNEELPRAVRQENYHGYLAKGQQFLEEGARNVPSSHLLPAEVAQLYRSRHVPPDHAKAAEWYARAAAVDGAPIYYKRFAAFELALAPGREQEAYKALRALYHESERHHKPTLMIRLHRLENELKIPPAQRLVPDPPQIGR